MNRFSIGQQSNPKITPVHLFDCRPPADAAVLLNLRTDGRLDHLLEPRRLDHRSVWTLADGLEILGDLHPEILAHRSPSIKHRPPNQAFNALLLFYRHVLGREFGKLAGVVRAKRRPYVPVVLSHAEVEALVEQLDPRYRLVALLLYGCGLRLSECLGLRMHCFNLDAMLLAVHDGKGQKDQAVPLPKRVRAEIGQQIETVRRLHQADLAAG